MRASPNILALDHARDAMLSPVIPIPLPFTHSSLRAIASLAWHCCYQGRVMTMFGKRDQPGLQARASF